MRLEKHPGYLGITSQGVIAIHADWPAYPEEHGHDLALLWLTAFPENTAFELIDDIDACGLFLAKLPHTNLKLPFDDKNFHAAIWHRDLIDLHKKKLILGVEGTLTYREWIRRFRASLPPGPYFIKLEDGTEKEIELPEVEDEIEPDENEWAAQIGRNGILVAPEGVSRSTELLASYDLSILGDKVEDLLRLGHFDSAIREACVSIEHQIKSVTGSELWGGALINEFIRQLMQSGHNRSSYLKILRTQIRTAFKYVRNTFMHNLVSLDKTRCLAILARIAIARAGINAAIATEDVGDKP